MLRLALTLLALVALACTTPSTPDASMSEPSTAEADSGEADSGEADSGEAGGARVDRPEREVGVKVLVEGLEGPTQLARHPDGRVIVAVLGAGGEGASTGSVIALDPDQPDSQEVLVEGLHTPTGVTVAAGRLWIMEPTRLVSAPLTGGDPVVVLDEMPNNGRSNGTITTLADGRLLFDTSGRRQGFDGVADSGTLWALDPADVGDQPSTVGAVANPILTGMKHAYAAVELGDGRVAVTEMSDGRFDGEPAPDELLVVTLDDQPTPTGGWPRCVGDRRPVEEFDGNEDLCDQALGSVALFDPGASPTSVMLAPDRAGTALVALWNHGQVVAVDLTAADPSEAVRLVTAAIANPQHLLADGSRVLVTGHSEGTISAFRCCDF